MNKTGCLLLIGVWMLLSYFMATWTQSNLYFWMTYFKEEPVEKLGFFWCWLLTFFPATFPLNLMSEIAEIAV